MRKLMGASLIATSLTSPVLAQGPVSDDSVIAWLPSNTETLIVAKGRVSDTSKPQPTRFTSLLTDIAAFGATLLPHA
jgi:hypothetical protein